MEEDSMITTANGTQYLRPDYLSPSNSTLDTKKSPLALLAQTCSQIGADTNITKPSSGVGDKPVKKEEKIREKASPSSSIGSSSPKSCFRPYEDDRTSKSAKKDSPRSSPKSDKDRVPAFHPYLAPYRASKAEVCRDPYCVGCPSKACPQGCLQCEKGISHHALAYAQLAALASQPYLCSWIGQDGAFCGKRFSTSDDLLAHLRAHTSDPLVHPLLRTYTPPLRYHPYSKPSPLPPSLLPPLPPVHPSLSPYYPYAFYSRLGATHP